MSQSETNSEYGNTLGIIIGLVLAAISLLPLMGVLLAGRSIQPYLEFPPIARSVTHEPFSWPVFVALVVLIVGAVTPFVVSISSFVSLRRLSLRQSSVLDRAPSRQTPCPVRSFPWWGWLGILWTLLAWFLAWTRFEWMGPLQAFTFTPLWLGYIVVVNALTCRRIGHCMMLHRPRYFLSLFPLSAALWWSFEYLNRFVQNWYYLGGRN